MPITNKVPLVKDISNIYINTQLVNKTSAIRTTELCEESLQFESDLGLNRNDILEFHLDFEECATKLNLLITDFYILDGGKKIYQGDFIKLNKKQKNLIQNYIKLCNYKKISKSYDSMKKQFEYYKTNSENNIQILNNTVKGLQNKLDMADSIIAISDYINSKLDSENILKVINDVVIGILGVQCSTIYKKKFRKLYLKETNSKNVAHHKIINQYNKNTSMDKTIGSFLENSDKPMNINIKQIKIHSTMGIPIKLNNELIGYIIVEHSIKDFLDQYKLKLMSAICNQIAMIIKNNQLLNRIKELANKDKLTQLYNRGYFFSVVNECIEEEIKDFTIVMIDIDDFKKCNDTFGHQYGDEVLKTVSNIIKNSVREEDIVARYGGEEIIIFLYDLNDIDIAEKRLDFIREKISNTEISYLDIKSKVTISIGISSYFHASMKRLTEVISEADKMLYKAKKNGKNRVEVFR